MFRMVIPSLTALVVAAVPATVMAQERPAQRTVTVSATGSVTREPDRARVQMAVETVAPTAAAATAENSAKMEALLAALRAQGLTADQIRTISFELHPEYARDRPVDRPEPRIVGYRARNVVQATIDDVDRVGAILDAAVNAGADRVTGLWFELRDPAAARADALRNAVARARTDAEAIAAALGEPLGPVVDISTTGVVPVRPLATRDIMIEATAAVPVEPGPLDVTAQITAVFQLGAP